MLCTTVKSRFRTNDLVISPAKGNALARCLSPRPDSTIRAVKANPEKYQPFSQLKRESLIYGGETSSTPFTIESHALEIPVEVGLSLPRGEI